MHAAVRDWPDRGHGRALRRTQGGGRLGTLVGSKPDYRLAQKTEDARRQYTEWLAKLREQYAPDKIHGSRADGSVCCTMARYTRGLTSFRTGALALRRRRRCARVPDGEFGAMMHVSLVNDGPVTIIVDSRNKNPE